jgi:hypothetical protein
VRSPRSWSVRHAKRAGGNQRDDPVRGMVRSARSTAD